jgi:hypothetical protein
VSCDIDDCDGSFAVDRTSKHRARKEHKCCACRGVISRGELYSYSFTVFDGEASELRRCARCDVIYDHLYELMKDSSGEFPAWDLNCGHSYSDRWGEEPPSEIARLAFMTPAEVLAELPIPPIKGGKILI